MKTALSCIKVSLRCVGCRKHRTITAAKFAKAKPFCPECGNMEVVVKVKASDRNDE